MQTPEVNSSSYVLKDDSLKADETPSLWSYCLSAKASLHLQYDLIYLPKLFKGLEACYAKEGALQILDL